VLRSLLVLVLVLAIAACGRLDFTSRPPDADVATPDVLDVDAGFCDQSPCKLVPDQCGCEVGQACQRVGATTDERACIAEGTVTLDGICTSGAECVAGHACIAVRDGLGRCMEYCAGDSDCSTGIACANLIEGVGIGFCGSPCTLASGCVIGMTCKVLLAYDITATGPVAVPICDIPTGASTGASCSSGLDCAAGLFCDVTGSGQCRPLCRFDGMLDCTTGTCSTVDAPIMLGGVTHGVCL